MLKGRPEGEGLEAHEACAGGPELVTSEGFGSHCKMALTERGLAKMVLGRASELFAVGLPPDSMVLLRWVNCKGRAP